MNLQEIKQAVDRGETVRWSNDGYTVIKRKDGEYLIKCEATGHAIGLSWVSDNGELLNGKEEDFYIKNQKIINKLNEQEKRNKITYELRCLNTLTKESELIDTFDYEIQVMMAHSRYMNRCGYHYIVQTVDAKGNRKPFKKYGHNYGK